MTQFAACYQGRRVLLTGHTGFKGSWLAAWLVELGAEVVGYSLPREVDGEAPHWDALGLAATDLRGDIRDAAALQRLMAEYRPEIVFHLAAQSLVRPSYREPLEAWSSNVLGTANVLEACRVTPGVAAIVVVTTDKVYANREWPWGYRECDELAGHDPYSASKAATELLCDSYRKSFWQQTGPLLVTARAGNVIGGGDWAEDRLIPDLVRAVQIGRTLQIRSPSSTRPWQHVLECLSGYLLLGQRLLQGDRACTGAWNFGPATEANRSVAEILEALREQWPALNWQFGSEDGLHEARLLYLDSAKARAELRWTPVWPLTTALQMTADWYRRSHERGEVCTREQLREFTTAARRAGCTWA
ncbi:CDP-glucose 4,6-dehydratase [Pseudomonas subflava]|uniref:CDP-glucose 4,6-dehydratase n=1 Tax=Pseudomonas subflava TaxID=2952933 RepID=UPI002079FF18|nr:CDP-glucose 4,6-dehydratase [Pseudomonas subflava]